MNSSGHNPRGTLILATYEMPRHLELVFAALERQSTRDFEVVVADDGSGEETRAVVEKLKSRIQIPITHLWQEHQGFRKCRILNEALRVSRGEVLIFLDGDCVPHRHFVRDHLEHQETGRFLAGRRMELGPKISAKLTPDAVRSGFFDWPRPSLILSALSGDSQNLQRSVRVEWPALRRRLRMEHVDDLKGCNYSVARKDLLAINGFDEAYEGYGREDTDVEIRLRNLGLQIKSVKGLCLQFHVWHPRREFTPANDDLLETAKRTRRTWCEQGMIKES